MPDEELGQIGGDTQRKKSTIQSECFQRNSTDTAQIGTGAGAGQGGRAWGRGRGRRLRGKVQRGGGGPGLGKESGRCRVLPWASQPGAFGLLCLPGCLSLTGLVTHVMETQGWQTQVPSGAGRGSWGETIKSESGRAWASLRCAFKLQLFESKMWSNRVADRICPSGFTSFQSLTSPLPHILQEGTEAQTGQEACLSANPLCS